jgi:hypothetical protein
MGKHYLATRKPERIKRIRKKLAAMFEAGLPLNRVDFDAKYRGYEYSVLQLVKWLDDLGYTALSRLESLMDEIDSNYSEAKREAIADIAYMAGSLHVNSEEVLRIAAEIAPPPSSRPYEARGLNAGQIIEDGQKHGFESPFDFLQKPMRSSGMFYRWRNLEKMTLAELQLLTLRLKDYSVPKPPPTALLTDRIH